MTKLEYLTELLNLYDLPAVLHGAPYDSSIYILRDGCNWKDIFNYVNFEAAKNNVPEWLSNRRMCWVGFYDPDKIIPKSKIYSEQDPHISWIKL